MKLPTRFLRILCATPLLALLLAGCATTQDDGDFDVTLVHVNSARGTEAEFQFVFTLRLQNASPDAVTLDGGAHKLYLNGVYVGQGLNNERVEVPRLATTTQQVTVNLSAFRLARAAYRIYNTHKADYRVDSTLYAVKGGGTRRIRAHKDGTVDLDDFVPPPGAGLTPVPSSN
jgi:LEA14-like dessication related protein